MIYISKNNRTKVITDNVSNFYPTKFDVYLDDNLLGEFDNLSTSKQYIIFELPKLDLEEKEYNMKLVYYQATIKEELVIVKDLYEQQIKSIDNNSKNNIKMYDT